MFRNFLCAFLLFSFFLTAESAEVTGNKFILPEEERGEAEKVEVDSSNILEEAFSGKEQFRRISPDSFAGVLGRPSRNIRWYPATDPENLNRMLIREASQSFDNSVVLFVETTGKKDGPKGSRLIFIDISRKICPTQKLLGMKHKEIPTYPQSIRFQAAILRG